MTQLALVESFEWPTEAEIAGFQQLADTRLFAQWLWDTEHRDVSKRTLDVLYCEYCVIMRRSQLRPMQLARQLRNAGIVSYRSATERTRYRVLPRAK